MYIIPEVKYYKCLSEGDKTCHTVIFDENEVLWCFKRNSEWSEIWL